MFFLKLNISVIYLFSVKLKPRDILDKYNEEIDGKKKDRFLLGIIQMCVLLLVVKLRSCLFDQTEAFATFNKTAPLPSQNYLKLNTI